MLLLFAQLIIQHDIQQLKEGTEGAEPHKDGVTSLMLAAQYGHADVVRLLLKHGADIDVKVRIIS
jgi:ankyrin repeat protein